MFYLVNTRTKEKVVKYVDGKNKIEYAYSDIPSIYHPIYKHYATPEEAFADLENVKAHIKTKISCYEIEIKKINTRLKSTLTRLETVDQLMASLESEKAQYSVADILAKYNQLVSRKWRNTKARSAILYDLKIKHQILHSWKAKLKDKYIAEGFYKQS